MSNISIESATSLPDQRARLLEACERLAFGPQDQASDLLGEIKAILKVGMEPPERVTVLPEFDINESGSQGLRALDILCRGRDSDEACFAAMYLIQAGANATEQPSPSEAAPLHSAAYHGNWRVLCTLLDMNVDANGLSGGIKQQLMGSNPIHALATGFRTVRAQDYAECFGALLAAGCDLEAKDRKRQRAIDIAMCAAATTRDSTLTDAMLEYGVTVEAMDEAGRVSQLSANSVASALVVRTGDYSLISRISGSGIQKMMRSINALRELNKEGKLGESVENDGHDHRAPQPG